jgi:hypothetical protein
LAIRRHAGEPFGNFFQSHIKLQMCGAQGHILSVCITPLKLRGERRSLAHRPRFAQRRKAIRSGQYITFLSGMSPQAAEGRAVFCEA